MSRQKRSFSGDVVGELRVSLRTQRAGSPELTTLRAGTLDGGVWARPEEGRDGR